MRGIEREMVQKKGKPNIVVVLWGNHEKFLVTLPNDITGKTKKSAGSARASPGCFLSLLLRICFGIALHGEPSAIPIHCKRQSIPGHAANSGETGMKHD